MPTAPTPALPASGTERLTYAYLVSAPHSGSTLLACLLGAHPAVSTVGEFGAAIRKANQCSCGSSYQECNLWQTWISRAAQQGIDFDIYNLGINLEPRSEGGRRDSFFYYLFPWRGLDRLRDLVFRSCSSYPRIADRAIDKAVRLARELCALENTSVFFDTMKNPYQVRFLSRHPSIHLKVIALIRDGRGVMNSLLKRERFSQEQAVATWLWSVRNMERVVAHYVNPADVFRLRLEDLCKDPNGVRSALFQFLGVDDGVELDYHDRSRRHIMGNLMRNTFNGEIRHDESWRKELTPERLQYFEARAGWLNRRYGYQS